MKKLIDYVKKSGQTRLGFVLILLIIYWLKTLWAYYVDFNLDTAGFFQNFIAIYESSTSRDFITRSLALYKEYKSLYSVAIDHLYYLAVGLFQMQSITENFPIIFPSLL
ncbi:Phosphoglycerol transferase and related proteins, alkaline phosphatase superfamily [Streptococcus suis 05ZYH33]|nr:Phosphoglycerol transferase and related proteins, alkaline phosphatase superfamily [Streptococcus suis 05ZYH33]